MERGLVNIGVAGLVRGWMDARRGDGHMTNTDLLVFRRDLQTTVLTDNGAVFDETNGVRVALPWLGCRSGVLGPCSATSRMTAII